VHFSSLSCLLHALPIWSPKLHLSNNIWPAVKLMFLKIQFCSSSRYFIPRTLFPNTLCVCFPINVRDHVSHPHRSTGKMRALFTLIFTNSGSKGEGRIFWTEWPISFRFTNAFHNFPAFATYHVHFNPFRIELTTLTLGLRVCKLAAGTYLPLLTTWPETDGSPRR
jgi:hypothetical protein